MRSGRRRAYRRGRWAERGAAWCLRLKGFRVLGHGVRTPVGEIDLIVRRGRVLALVEVKARTHRAAALGAVSARQRRRIERAAEAFLQRRPDLAALDLRFDVVAVAPWRWPRHVMGAWRAGE